MAEDANVVLQQLRQQIEHLTATTHHLTNEHGRLTQDNTRLNNQVAHLQQNNVAAQQVQQQLGAMAHAPRAHTHHLKPAPASTYSGMFDSKPVDTWCFELERVFMVTGATEHQTRIEYASSLMRGSALTWLQAYVRDHPNYSTSMSWPEFKVVLRTKFMPIQAEEQARQELLVIRQGKRSVQRYADHFTSVTQRLPNLDDDFVKMIFIKGLHADHQTHLLRETPATTEAAMAMAIKLEAIEALRQRTSDPESRTNRYYGSKPQGNRNWSSHRPYQQQSRPMPSSYSGNGPAPMELGATATGHYSDEPAQYGYRTGVNHVEADGDDDEYLDVAALDELVQDADVDEDTEYTVLAAVFNRQQSRPNEEYKPRWHKIIPGLTATEEVKLYREKKCYICRGSGHRLLACPKLRDGSLVKRDRINNVERSADEYESKNGYGQ